MTLKEIMKMITTGYRLGTHHNEPAYICNKCNRHKSFVSGKQCKCIRCACITTCPWCKKDKMDVSPRPCRGKEPFVGCYSCYETQVLMS